MRIFRRADDIVPTPAEAEDAFLTALAPLPRHTLTQLADAGVVKVKFYAERLTHRPIAYMATPARRQDGRYFPEDWAALVAEAFAKELNLFFPEDWDRLGVRHAG